MSWGADPRPLRSIDVLIPYSAICRDADPQDIEFAYARANRLQRRIEEAVLPVQGPIGNPKITVCIAFDRETIGVCATWSDEDETDESLVFGLREKEPVAKAVAVAYAACRHWATPRGCEDHAIQ